MRADGRDEYFKEYKRQHKGDTKEYMKEWHKEHYKKGEQISFPDRRTKYSYLARYGITTEQYNSLFETQKGCCAVCGIHQSKLKRRLAVDHNHTTGKVRGLLCNCCNIALGLTKEDVAILEKLVVYITNALKT